MKIVFYLILFYSPLLVKAQEDTTTGIHFEQGSNWSQILKRAKTENKFIFVDCYATWCGPCKYMSKNVFTIAEVGNYFNDHFISVAVQMDKTNSDPEIIRNWYSDAERIANDYTVSSYPTYLFYSPDGLIVHRIVGGEREYKVFLTKAAEALNPGKQYYSFIRQYKMHAGDSVFLKTALDSALALSDEVNAAEIGRLYFECLKNPLTKDNLRLIRRSTYSSKQESFLFLLNNMLKADSVIGESGVFEGFLREIIANEEIVHPYFIDKKPADWKEISQRLHKKYPELADRILAQWKMNYYKDNKEWSEYERAILFFMKEYGRQLGDYETNNRAWDVFELSTNKKLLEEAEKWSYRTVIKYPDVGQFTYIDTYANLLYKLGRVSDAILWEKKAIEIDQSPDEKTVFENTLHKMEKGEKTWKDEL